MKKVTSHIYTGKTLTVGISENGRSFVRTIENSHPNWKQVEKLYKAKQLEKMLDLFDVASAINTKFQGKFAVKNGKVYRGDQEVKGYLVDRIIFFMREGLPFDRLLKFADNLYANPSENSRNELYSFLEHGNFPITEDGCFLAYRGVQNDWYSKTGGDITVLKGKVNAQGQIFNGIGEQIEVKRSEVDDNQNNHCSKGLHVGTHGYAKGWADSNGRVVLIKVNPRDAVSVPTDCNRTKLRVCAYEVVDEQSEILHEIKDSNRDKVAVVRRENAAKGVQPRLANGRFASNK